MSTPAPSPITNPSRRASNGRESPVGDSACIELKLPNPNGVSVASAPPTTTASASSYWIIRSAQPIACAPLEQAETTLYIWPLSPELHRHRRGGRVRHLRRDPERETSRAGPGRADLVVLELDRLDPADPGGENAAEPHRVVREFAVPAGVGDRLAGRDQREL